MINTGKTCPCNPIARLESRLRFYLQFQLFSFLRFSGGSFLHFFLSRFLCPYIRFVLRVSHYSVPTETKRRRTMNDARITTVFTFRHSSRPLFNDHQNDVLNLQNCRTL
ncbi:unnamed protein product [Bacillus phage SPP1]|uniref:Bacteriophage SPP1 complete nucleotide sequence n=1 Tax=Bacillus phage SPP1 TaxID=10724 RepID=O48494_BPSPP|nr:hypothetical protein SPP1p089 [Bacillus phage SPP1]CAA66500.1 unnamed protein product [Bacillus phage SPP1]